MKSKKAEEYLRRNKMQEYGQGEFYEMDVDRAIELVEDDLREVAVKAFCKMCGRCAGKFYNQKLPNGIICEIDDYIETYDQEQPL